MSSRRPTIELSGPAVNVPARSQRPDTAADAVPPNNSARGQPPRGSPSWRGAGSGTRRARPAASSTTKQQAKPAAPTSNGARRPAVVASVLIETGPTAEATIATLANMLKLALILSDGRSVLT